MPSLYNDFGLRRNRLKPVSAKYIFKNRALAYCTIPEPSPLSLPRPTERGREKTTMDGFRIEKGIPLPQAKRDMLQEALRALKVGDSFLCPSDVKSPTQRAHSAARFLGIKVATRTVDGGVRVWRVK